MGWTADLSGSLTVPRYAVCLSFPDSECQLHPPASFECSVPCCHSLRCWGSIRAAAASSPDHAIRIYLLREPLQGFFCGAASPQLTFSGRGGLSAAGGMHGEEQEGLSGHKQSWCWLLNPEQVFTCVFSKCVCPACL